MSGLSRQPQGATTGKYPIVLDRSGEYPPCDWFVLLETDPACISALLAYADASEKMGRDPEYVSDIRNLVLAWSARASELESAPDAPLEELNPEVRDFPGSLIDYRDIVISRLLNQLKRD